MSSDEIFVGSESVRPAINVTSFGETKNRQVDDYYRLVKRTPKLSGLLLFVNPLNKANLNDYSWPTDCDTVVEKEPFFSRIGPEKMWRYPIMLRVIRKRE